MCKDGPGLTFNSVLYWKEGPAGIAEKLSTAEGFRMQDEWQNRSAEYSLIDGKHGLDGPGSTGRCTDGNHLMG